MTDTPTISREQLIDITERTLASHVEIIDSCAASRMRDAAATMTAVAHQAWRYGDCGCLIGTAFLPELRHTISFGRGVTSGEILQVLGNRLHSVGLTFDALLREALDLEIDAVRVEVVG